MTVNKQVPAVILSGGSEIVSLAVAEALAPYNVPLVVISLGKSSIIRHISAVLHHRQIQWPPITIESTIKEISALLKEIGAGKPHPWPVFATEDGGLRLLVENRRCLESYLAIPRGARDLKLGGLDKAELFQFLSSAGLEEMIAPTIVLDDVENVRQVVEVFGGEAIIKPALKPLSMDLDVLGAKAVLVRKGDDEKGWQKQLRRAWPSSSHWIAQPFLQTPPEGEASWWGIRNFRGVAGITAWQRWKSPRFGGTASFVETSLLNPVSAIAKDILNSLNLFGLAELEFLQDANGNWRLLELNIRPWLQVGITPLVNFPVVHMLYEELSGMNVEVQEPSVMYPKSWVNVERMILAAISGEYGSRSAALLRTVKLVSASDYRAVYSTPFSGVRARWLRRMVQKAFGR